MSRPNFPLAFPLAIAVGAATAFFVSMLMIPIMGNENEKTFAGAATAASLIAWYAAMICAFYVLVIGIGVVVYVRNTRRVPSLATALVVSVLAGGLPFIVTPMFERGPSSRFTIVLLPVLAVTSAIATAWTFWRVGLRGRTLK